MTLLAAKSNLRLPVVDETALVFKTGSPAITATLDANALTAARTYALPDASTTLAGLSVVQTFTAAQTFSQNVTLSTPATTITATTAELLLRQTGDTFGATSLSIRNRQGAAGAIFGNASLDLVDFGFSPLTTAQANLRFEGRSGFQIGTGNTYGEFQFILRSLVGNGLIVFGVGDNTIISRIPTALTATIKDVFQITHITSGTPAAGFGAALRFGLETSAVENQNAARLASAWNVATHASRSADLIGYASDFGGEREIWRGRASGTAPMFAVLGATPIVRQAHIVDADGTLADVTSKFNSLLAYLENFGFIATS